MMEARDIIIRPVVTEKSIGLMENNKYVFKVALSANKIEIKKAVEEIFKVKVVDVNTVRVKGKEKRMGRSVGRTSDYKKAIVQLAEGDSIEIFEGL
ncbi:MAG: 50S ribosomal protein L23 [Peptococcaceae bacterium]|nr:50S ribosomal protein L23 [Peptococcaceae bacterium]MBO5114591.1 50S ribosomal protein L23 [Peptococcaceae bacterium]MBO5365886.1 50S ribosomal protein L23 [Peptococcaceae bacterium]MBO5430196.1 50S ribosomal protein L23 [Peptococcaceae bacterium]MBP3341741.1 50S ribosomal protein L23 [Peptococcaceae bacterium]